MSIVNREKNPTLHLPFILLLISILFLGCSKEEPEIPEPTKIVLSSSVNIFDANGADVINFEVDVFDQNDELMPNQDWDLYVNDKIHGSRSFSTITKGVYVFVARMGELESNTLSIKADAVPKTIELSVSSTTIIADGQEEVEIEVTVLDNSGDEMPGAFYQLYLNEEEYNSSSFSTNEAGEYTILAKINEIQSNPVTINAVEPAEPNTIELSVSSSKIIADGREEVEFDVTVLDKSGDEIPDASYQLYINEEEYDLLSFSTNEVGEYVIVAKINEIQSNPVTINAVKPAELVAAITLGTDSHLIIANNSSVSNLNVQFFNEDGKLLNYDFDYKILVNNAEYPHLEFKTDVSAIHEIVVKLNNTVSNSIRIAARQEKSYEEIEIPVIFHIVHLGEQRGTGTNLDATYIHQELDKLNRGFSNNYGSVNSNAVDIQVKFRLATINENGGVLQEPGINRINGTEYDKGYQQNEAMQSSFYVPPPIVDAKNKNSGYNTNLIFNEEFSQVDIPDDGEFGYEESKAIGNDNNWNNKLYYNVYIMPIQRNLNASGYAYLPFIVQPGALPGLYDYPSEAEKSIPPYAQGCVVDTEAAMLDWSGTIVHEAGHNLGLFHVFSTDGCITSDYCADTYSYEKNYYNRPCPENLGSDIRDNFMDYYSDKRTFTYEQKERMRFVLENGFFYRDLKYSGR